jgi:peptidoglycan/LPS O-acetylase OafA/YrhL
MPPPDEAVRLARLQAAYYIATGLLPFVSMRAFETITGPKTDRWLVKTVGLLVTVIGGALGLAARRRRVAPEVVLVAAGSAGALAAIDIVYVAKRRSSPVYLLDAVVEIGLFAGWLRHWRQTAVKDELQHRPSTAL